METNFAFTFYTIWSVMNLNGTVSCLQKMNHITDSQLVGMVINRVHVYSVSTHAQLSRNDCGLAFNAMTLVAAGNSLCHCHNQCIFFYKPIRGWFWNCTCVYWIVYILMFMVSMKIYIPHSTSIGNIIPYCYCSYFHKTPETEVWDSFLSSFILENSV